VKKILLTFSLLLIFSGAIFGQVRKDQNPVTYEELYDEPYAVNKLFLQFQPIYGELFATNVNAGFGFEATYFWEDKAQFRAHARKTYNAKFDFTRELARQTSDVINQPRIFNYYELGGTWHIQDFEESSKSKMVLYRKSYGQNRWASRVPISVEVPSTVRKIYGGRLGGFSYDSHTDVNRALKEQGKSITDLVDEEGNSMPATMDDGEGSADETNVFTGIDVKGIYVGGSMSWFRNIAVDFDKYEEGVDDLMLTLFFDVLVAPSVKIDDMILQEANANGDLVRRRFSGDVLDTRMFGFRLGIDGKFNRTFSWAYGGEFGYRPSLAGRGFYAMLKISFPVFSTNLDYSVEAFGK
jgi:hypothetical protein